jgi:hypothetical protein
MDAAIADRWAVLKKDGPSRALLKSSSSWYSMSRTHGPRDMISLVIPRIGDNNANLTCNSTCQLDMQIDFVNLS